MKKYHIKLIDRLKKELSEPQRILITTHQGADGDGLGASLALYLFLKKQGHDALVVTPNDYPEFLHWLPANDSVLIYMRQKQMVEEFLETTDFIFHIDYNHLKRSADMSHSLYKSKATRILIDHHPEPELPSKYIFSETEVSSTCELLFNIMRQWDVELVDCDIATCLYTGVMTDTGNFCYRNANHAQTYITAARLIGFGIDREGIYDKVYDNYSESRMRLMGFCLNEKMEVYPQYATALISLNKEEQQRYDFVIGESEGFVNLPLSIKGIRFAAFFLEKEEKVKMSFRSKGNFAVNEFSKKHFGGGGHPNAAGGDAKMPMDELLQKFRDLLPLYENEI